MESTQDPLRTRPLPQTLQMQISPENSILPRILGWRKQSPNGPNKSRSHQMLEKPNRLKESSQLPWI